MGEIAKLQQIIDESKNIVFLEGREFPRKAEFRIFEV